LCPWLFVPHGWPPAVKLLELILQKAASTTWELAPYVVVGVLLGEALRYTPATRLLERACRRRPALAVLLSALLGAASPLCTYGTVPVVLELLRAGVPVGPLATFLATSSLMNPQLLLITWGGLGAEMAAVRVVAVLGFGLLLGGLLYALPRRWSVQPMLAQEQEGPDRRGRHFGWRGFAANSYRTLQFVGFYVLLGILLGAAVEVLVPGRWILKAFGAAGWLQVLVAALLGLPVYACGGGTIPLVRSLMREGMSAGAALAFLVAGPATRMPPLLALATLLRPTFIVVYVVALLAYSVVVGVLYGLF
jgi:uncharacterized membrane protein YraQ (UPF0718 family)